MLNLTLILINAWACSLLCLCQRKHSQKARQYASETELAIYRVLGIIALLLGLLALIATHQGDLGIITWFGLHPLLVISAALAAGIRFSVLVYFSRLAPFLALALLAIMTQTGSY